MNTVLKYILLLATSQHALSQNLDQGKSWQAQVKVVDNKGQPVGGANVTIGFYGSQQPFETIGMKSISGITGKDGVFTSSGASPSVSLFFGASKRGYYKAHTEKSFPADRNNGPQSKINVELMLKAMVNPIAMYSRKINQNLPVHNSPLGFDMIKGDWVKPYGQGETSDILVTKNKIFKSSEDYDGSIVVYFPNVKEGIQLYSPSDLERTSSYKSPYEAPDSGYQFKMKRVNIATPGQPANFEYDPSRIYLFRIRCVLDNNGNIKSAYYGKMYGDFMNVQYCLNPNANDRNIEYDISRNLFRNLKRSEQPDQP